MQSTSRVFASGTRTFEHGEGQRLRVAGLWRMALSLVLVCSMFMPGASAFADEWEPEPGAEEAAVPALEPSTDLDTTVPPPPVSPSSSDEPTPSSELSTGEDSAVLQTLEEQKTYAVTITQTANGTVTPNVSETVAGSTVTLTATPDDSTCGLVPGSIKVLTDSQKAPRVVRGDGSAQNPFTFTMPDDSVTVTAEFVHYNRIIIADTIGHGSISTDVTEAIRNEIITITVKPDDGYRLLFKQTGGTRLNQGKSLTLTDEDGNVIKYRQSGSDWIYDPKGSYTWVIPDQDNLMNKDGKKLNIEATTYYLKMPECNVVLSAEFAPVHNVTVDPGIVGGTINLDGRTKGAEGELVSPYVTLPDSGYRLVTGSVKVLDTSGKDIGTETELTNGWGFFMPAYDVVVSAEFEKIPVLDVDLRIDAVLDSAVTLRFTTHKDAPSYWINWREKGDQSTNRSANNYANDTTGTERSYTVTGLKNGVEYEFYVYCDGMDTAYVTATPVGIPATAVRLNVHAVETVPGKEVVLYHELEPSASMSGVNWSSSDETIATIEQNGRIRILAVGTVTITATAKIGEVSDSCVITVKQSVDQALGGSMIVSDVDTTYDENGGRVAVPFTVTVPTDKPDYRFTFAFSQSAASQFRINGISLKGTALDANTTTEVDDVKVQVGAIPYPLSGLYGAWVTVIPRTGKFLTAGKAYEFLLDVEILATASPDISIPLNSTYCAINYYDPDYDNRSYIEVRQNGTVHATWQGVGEEPPTSGSGSNMVYNLFTADDLLWYASKWNTDVDFDNGATLYADIDLTGEAFTGIGTSAHPLSKNFNGNGHTVTYQLTQTDDGGAIGFIRYFEGSNNNSISGLTTAGTLVVSGNNVKVGGIVGDIKGSSYIGSGCINKVTIQVTGIGGSVGGVAGSMDSTYSSWNPVFGNSVNYGSIEAPNAGFVGGIAGYVRCIAEFNEVVNNGAVTGSGFVGGVVGSLEYAASGKRIGSNTNNGSVTSLGGEATGGIFGKLVPGNVGGYWARSTREDGNLNYGAVLGASTYVGGIAGYVDDQDAQFIVMNFNEGSVTSTGTGLSYVAGVLGYLTGSDKISVIGNINKGVISGGPDAVKGGIIAYANSKLADTLCTDNYFAEQEALSDAAFASSAPNSFLSLNGWAPNYSGSPDDDGSAGKPYKLANAFDILWFASQVNGGTESDNRPIRSAFVELSSDIDLTDYPAFEGIGIFGVGRPTFHGSFDGKGHTVTLALDASAQGAKYDTAALFQQCSAATIKNLTVAGFVKSKPNVGSAAGVALGSGGCTFENVTNRADVTAFNNAAGVTTGDWNGPDRLINCKNYGTINGGNAAGIITQVGGQCVIQRCENHGDVTAYGVAAGIVGAINGGSKSNSGTPSYYITDCVNNGAITSLSQVTHDAYTNQNDPSTRHTAGGIVGTITGAIVEIRNCTNNGLVQTAGNSAGGIVGAGHGEWNIGAGETSQMSDVRIINCVNNGDVKSIYNGDDPNYLERIGIGGIIGQTGEYDWTSGNPGGTQGLTVVGNTNNGIVSGPAGSNVGTIVGVTDTGKNSSGGTVTIGDNWSSTEAIGGGKNWNNPRYKAPDAGLYDPDTQEIIDGKLVEKQKPEQPDLDKPPTDPDGSLIDPDKPPTDPDKPTTDPSKPPTDPDKPSTGPETSSPDLGTPSAIQDSVVASPISETAVASLPDPVVSPAAQATPTEENLPDPTETPTSDSPSTDENRTPTFFEIVADAVVNNPVIIVIIVIAAVALAFFGGIWRYRRINKSA